MTIIAVVGDATTTTSVALAVGWPVDDDVIVLEADPSGGSLAGWLDTPATPSLGTMVATVGSGGDRRSVSATFEAMAQRSAAGLRFLPNAVRARAAHRAVDEAATAVLPAIAEGATAVITDTGTHTAGRVPATGVNLADVVVVVHRQATASAAAATVRIERLVETLEEFAHLDAAIVLAVIGAAPFDPAEIGEFVDASVPDMLHSTVAIADDPLAAATLAGRAGVSARRLRRLPLMRDTAALAMLLYGLLHRGEPRATTIPGARAMP